RERRKRYGDRGGDHRHGAEPASEGGRRGRRDVTPGGVPQEAWLSRRAGLLLQQAGAGQHLRKIARGLGRNAQPRLILPPSRAQFSFASSSLTITGLNGMKPLIFTTDCPCADSTIFMNSRSSGGSGLPAALLTYQYRSRLTGC